MTNTDSFGTELKSPRRDKARRKLLKLLARGDLEQLSKRTAPWHADRLTLETEILGAWPHDEIDERIGQIIAAAK